MSFVYDGKSREELIDRLGLGGNEIVGLGGGSFSIFYRMLSKNEDLRVFFREK